MEKQFILKGTIAFSEDKDHITTFEQGYLVCQNGICLGVYEDLPAQYKGSEWPIHDHGTKLIIPGLTDLHLHAPQYTFRGLGMDLELLDWLNTHTFPEEAKYSNLEYARKAYEFFTYDLQRCFTTRAVIFATIHNGATIGLMDQLEKSGMVTYVGRVNMDRNGGENLQETNAETSIKGTIEWLDAIEGRYKNTFPILTPRFIPSCSDELMRGLGKLAKDRKLRIQSHLSENPSECAWVQELVPASKCYGHAYEIFDTLGDVDNPAIMAHCVYSSDEELAILQKHGVYVAHCADSNMNLTSGIAPASKILRNGINIGIATDVAGGSNMNMLKMILVTLQASKMRYRYVDQSEPALTFAEAFYMATMGGGKYFGKVGTFKEGYEFDALVLEDGLMHSLRKITAAERLERICYNDSDCFIIEKYVKGNKIFTR